MTKYALSDYIECHATRKSNLPLSVSVESKNLSWKHTLQQDLLLHYLPASSLSLSLFAIIPVYETTSFNTWSNLESYDSRIEKLNNKTSGDRKGRHRFPQVNVDYIERNLFVVRETREREREREREGEGRNEKSMMGNEPIPSPHTKTTESTHRSFVRRPQHFLRNVVHTA